MDDQELRNADRTSRRKQKMARMAVSKRLAIYHQSLVAALSEDSLSFFERVMDAANRNISAQRAQREQREVAALPFMKAGH